MFLDVDIACLGGSVFGLVGALGPVCVLQRLDVGAEVPEGLSCYRVPLLPLGR
jgi:hypothetical protein